MANGRGSIANLQGAVNAQGELLVSAGVALASLARQTEGGHLDGVVAYTDAPIIPPPPPGATVVVTSIIASAQTAGPFSLLFESGVRRYGPIWLPPGAGPAVVTGRVFTSGPLLRRLPVGEGLTVTTSAPAPQSIDVEYFVIPAPE